MFTAFENRDMHTIHQQLQILILLLLPNFKKKKNKKIQKNPTLWPPFLWIRFNCLKAIEPLQEDSLHLTIKSCSNLTTEPLEQGVKYVQS